MADMFVCDICGERIRKYNGWYRFKYGNVYILHGDYEYAGNRIDVCKDCIEQVKELRKVSKGWNNIECS